MHFYGKAQETAGLILNAFKNPESLPGALAPIFIHRKDNVPCRAWSWGNQLLTALAGTADGRGYRQWQEVGRYVNKGAKAYAILAPCKKVIEKVNPDTGDKEKVPVVVGFRSVPVFRIEDTEGAEIATEDTEVRAWLDSLPLRHVADSWGLSLEAYNGEAARFLGYYHGGHKVIALGVKNLSTFLHELVHAADHKLGNLVEHGQHWRSEIVAELGGAVLAKVLGLDYEADLGGAYSYVERYAHTAKKTAPAACLDVLDRLCKAVALILDTAETLKPETTLQSAVA